MTDEYRLPRNVVPRRYQLRLEPDLATATFAGSETIKVDVVEAVDRFVLNAADLDLTSVSVRVGGETLSAEVELDEKQQRATLRFPRTIDSGEAELDIEFCGVLNDQLQGFYRSTFTDVDGVEQTVATTQFEATDARRAFPCWDEPDFKASFQVTIVIPNDLLVVSNTMEESRQAIGDKVEVRFAETMVMSTYLVAFVVGPFEATEPIDVDGTPVRIVTPKGKLHLAPYAAGVRRLLPPLSERLLRDPVPERQGRPHRHPGLRLWGHGEPRLYHLSRGSTSPRWRQGDPGREDPDPRRRGPRVGPHVVRRSGDHEVVGRNLVERGIRHIHGDEGNRRYAAGVEAVAHLWRRRPAMGSRDRSTLHVASRRVRGALT